MSINYTKVPWDTTSYVNPTNMNRLEDGLKSACDGVDTINASLPNYDNSREILDLKMLGYTIPRECPIQNEKTSSGYVVKVGRVDLGSLNFVGEFWALLPDAKNSGDCYCNKYTATKVWSGALGDKQLTLNIDGLSSTQYVIIKDSSYTDATAFRASLKGTYLYYELATPYTLSLDGAEKFNETDSLKMLGWTVPSEMPIKNYTDSNGVFHQRVGRIDLGTLSWGYNSECFYTDEMAIPNSKYDHYLPGYPADELYCIKYTPSQWPMADKCIALNPKNSYGNRVAVKDSAYTDATSFRTAMSGVYLYYELATEVTYSDGSESESCRIIENQYGIAKCYTNGYMECVREIDATATYETQWDGLYVFANSTSWSFAMSFVDTPNVEISARTTTSVSGWQIWYRPLNIAKNAIANIFFARPTSTTEIPFKAIIKAYGRWK